MAKSLRLFVPLSIVIFLHLNAAGQSVSINTTGASAASTAILDVTSTSKGILIPRMNKTQKNGITSPATGLMIFQDNPDSTGFYYYSGSRWVWITDALNSDTSAWQINGNNNITASRFLGTLNDSALKLKVNNQP